MLEPAWQTTWSSSLQLWESALACQQLTRACSFHCSWPADRQIRSQDESVWQNSAVEQCKVSHWTWFSRADNVCAERGTVAHLDLESCSFAWETLAIFASELILRRIHSRYAFFSTPYSIRHWAPQDQSDRSLQPSLLSQLLPKAKPWEYKPP